jgi:hypothetical protein
MRATAADGLALGAGARFAQPRPAVATADDWPYTTRLMPWLVAGLMVMVWVIPFDAIEITSVSAPIDLKLDRVVLALVGLAWLLTLGGSDRIRPRFRSSPVNWAMLAFLAVSVAGVAANDSILVTQNELALAIKKLALLFSFAAFFFFVTTTVRPSEVRRFVFFMLGLACITAFGVIIEYKLNYNIFYAWSEKVFRAPFYVHPEVPDPPFGRRSITGPTLHGIAVATMLAMALPFMVVGILRTSRRKRLAYIGMVTLLLIGGLSTQRKTGLAVPAAALLTLTIYKPRPMLRLLPAGLVVLAAIFVLAHGAAVGVKSQFVGSNLESTSTTGRTSDYDATRPDIFTYPVLGRGEGTYDPYKYRFLDNEYLHRIIETGFLGLAAYIALIATGMAVSHKTLKKLGPVRGSPAMAAVAAGGGFAACSAVFDVMSYPQPMYVFLLIIGLMVVLSHAPPELRDPEKAPV